MFSKALYKQSWKANWVLWLSTTLVSTFVLVIIMFLIGGDGMGSLTTSFTETIVYDELESQYENMSLNYYSLSDDVLLEFDQKFLDFYLDEFEKNPTDIDGAIEEAANSALIYVTENILSKMQTIDSTIVLDDDKYNELLFSVLSTFGVIYESGMETYLPPLFAHLTDEDYQELLVSGMRPENLYDEVNTKSRNDLRGSIARAGSTNFLVTAATSEDAINTIISELSHLGITKEIYNSFGFDDEGLRDIATTAILTYQARIDYEIAKAGDDADYALIRKELKATITKTIFAALPDTISNMVSEMGEQDMYSSTMVAMYYKIVGMLISIIYIIMASVNLIAGQVDSGSMAYVLSTGTKRKQVTNTQSLFLVSSSFFMYVVTTGVSLLVYTLATPVQSEMTYVKLLIFGLGTFLVSFAFAGINFLTSSIFNRSRVSMAIGGGLSILMLIFTILGMFGSETMPSMMRMEVLNFFNYMTIISFIDGAAILEGSMNVIWKFGILAVIGIVTLFISGIVFKKKDLPL